MELPSNILSRSLTSPSLKANVEAFCFHVPAKAVGVLRSHYNKCQKCGEEKSDVTSRAADRSGFYYCDDCNEAILNDSSHYVHRILKENEDLTREKWARNKEELKVWQEEQDRTANTCTECGAKHHCNADICGDCWNKMYRR